jgi:O-antigen ligase
MMEAARHKHVHNVFLQWAVETGVIGVLLFCVFMAFIIMALVKIMAKFPRGSFEFAAACGGLFVVICFLLGGLFDYLHDPIILTPLFTLLGFALAGGTPRAAEDRGP